MMNRGKVPVCEDGPFFIYIHISGYIYFHLYTFLFLYIGCLVKTSMSTPEKRLVLSVYLGT